MKTNVTWPNKAVFVICAYFSAFMSIAAVAASDASVIKISAGSIHSMFITSDNAYWAMGENSYGQLGDGTTNTQISPKHITVPDYYAPAIATQPANATINAGENARFAAAATGNPAPAYQWQFAPPGSSTWANISGATSATLTLSTITSSMHSTQYRCLASNSVQSGVASAAATLTVNVDPLTAAQSLKTQLELAYSGTVIVTGSVNLSLVGGATVANNIIIVGADATSTITGNLTLAADASGAISGITFTSGTLTITGANGVYVSHCTFTDTPVVINGGADNIAFSWNKFTATVTGTEGGSAMRIDNAGASTGILLDHNYFGDGLKTDIPAVTNARVVMFNNYIATTGNTTATIVGAGAQILSERNIYQSTHNPLTKQGSGKLRALDNFINATTGTLDPGTDIVFVPAYSRLMYPAGSTTPFDASAVATLITTNAGNTAGRDSVTPPASVINATASIAASVTGVGSGTTASAANVPTGGGFTLTASAANFTPTTHQWYLDNFIIPGATASTHVVTNATAADAGAYAVALTTPAGEIVTSAAFTMTVEVLAAPVITAHPASQTTVVGGRVIFNVTATGQGLTYQWQKNSGDAWTDIPGATATSYIIINARQSEAASYRVLVGNPSDTKTSNPATLTVNGAGGDQTSLTVTAVAAGNAHSLFVTSDGKLWAMGDNSNGQLGDGTGGAEGAYKTAPVHVANDVVAVAAGGWHSLFVTSDGKLHTMGYNYEGRLGLGDTADRHTPVQVPGNFNVVAVAAGAWHSLFVTSDGKLYAMGDNSYSQLGDGTSDNHDYGPSWKGVDQKSPVQVVGASNVIDIAAGERHSFYLTGDGKLYAMGMSFYDQGQSGPGTPVQIATDVIAIAAGYWHNLYVTSDGTLHAMMESYGQSNYGQLGDGTGMDYREHDNTPLPVATNVATVTAGEYHSLYITNDGNLHAMGLNEYGQLGDGTGGAADAHKTTPVSVSAATNVAIVVAGGNHSLYITNDGKLYAMGNNEAGQLGDGTTTNRTTPVQVHIVPTITTQPQSSTVTAGQNAIFTIVTVNNVTPSYRWQILGSDNLWTALDNDTTYSGVTTASLTVANVTAAMSATQYRCFFSNIFGNTFSTAATLTVDTTPTAPAITTSLSNQIVTAGQNVTFTVAVSGNPAPTLQWQSSPDGATWTDISDATDATGATTTTLIVNAVTTAMNGMQYRCLASNTVQPSVASTAATLTVNPALAIVANVASTGYHSLFVKSDGSLWAAGDNAYGQLGDGTGGEWGSWRSMPVQVASDVVAVAAGEAHSLFVKSDSSLWAMGDNSYGQLGTGTGGTGTGSDWDSRQLTPVYVADNVKAVTAGDWHSLFVKNDGTLWAMGDNSYGQLGDGIDGTGTGSEWDSRQLTPVQVASDVKAIAAGYGYSLFVKNDGTLWAMGFNSYGQLGDGTTTNRSTPVQVASDVVAVAAGDQYSCSLFVKSDGTLWAMGDNSYGQYGDGTTTSRSTPVQVASDVAIVATGRSHSLFVKNDGTLWAAGDNVYGQLGDGPDADARSTPVQVAANVTAVAAGNWHSLFVKDDGTFWAMGDNEYGQLGDGTGGRWDSWRSTPVPVHIVPIITTQPQSSTVAVGQNALFTIVTVNDVTPSYEWQILGGDNLWTALANDTTYSGVTTVSLTVANVTAAMSATQYRCLFSNALGNTFSETITLTIATPPVVTAQPESTIVALGQNATFTVVASGTPAPNHRWQILGTDNLWTALVSSTTYGGVTTASLTIANVTAGMTGAQYRCVLSNMADDSIASNAATLTVNTALTAPAITAPPSNQTVTAGQNATFSITVSGNPAPTLQWQSSPDGATWTDISDATGVTGATITTLTVNAVTAAMNGMQYRCLASNSVQSYVTSNAATLIVSPVPATGADFAAGSRHSLFVRSDGTLWAMGYNEYGQLGDGTYRPDAQSTPVQVASDVVAVAAGANHSLFVKSDGTLWAMGYNMYGQLGDGTDEYDRNTPVQVAVNVKAVAAGNNHSLFLKRDGTLWAMGDNYHGQLGDGTTTNRDTPVQVASNVVAVAAGAEHSLFVKGDGTLWAMGYNGTGQLGDGTGGGWDNWRSTPVQVAANVKAVAAGNNHSLFVKNDGTLWAMGDNYYGQLGDGTNVDGYTPMQVFSDVVAVAAGADHSLFVKSDGTLWAMGDNYNGQLGDGTDGEWDNWQHTPVQVDANVKAVAAGNNHSLFIKNDGTFWAMGDNDRGQLGDGTTTDRNMPVQAHTAPFITTHPQNSTVIAGRNATFSVTVSGNPAPTLQWLSSPDGTTWTNISDATGATGATTATLTLNAVTVAMNGTQYRCLASNSVQSDVASNAATLTVNPAPITVADFAAGDKHSLFVRSDGTLWAMGDNDRGQLGDGTYGFDGQSTPVQVASDVVAVAAGEAHSLFVKSDSSLWAMGNSAYGQLGDGTGGSGWSGSQQHTPVQVVADVKAVAAGANHSLFVKSDGALWAMGDNYYGQLGDGTDAPDRNTPVQVGADVKAVAAGMFHSLFVKNDGTLWAMGDNSSGQLGDGTSGTSTWRDTPVQVDSDVIAVAAGDYHSLFVKNDGTLWAMGDNYYGQLGDDTSGTNVDRYMPVQVASDVVAVAAGANHSLFVKSDGTLWAMGDNYYGQLGDGTGGGGWANRQPTPVQVASDVVAVAAGATHSLFAKNDGTLWAMGSNNYGQLGDGTGGAWDSWQGTPVQVHIVPAITAQPQSSTIVAGQNALFTIVTSTNATPSYQWQILGSDNQWTALDNDTTYSGVTTASLTVANVTAAMSATQYRCFFSNTFGDTFSEAVTLTIAAPPAIITQPESKTVGSGQNATFTIVATGTPAPDHRWQVLGRDSLWVPLSNSTTYGGVTTASLTIANVTTDMSDAQYCCALSNMADEITSNAVTLTVTPALTAPTITTHPANQTVTSGQNATFSIVTSGNPTPTLQWQFLPDGATWTNISDATGVTGATTTTLTLNAVTVAMNGMQYRCFASNSVQSGVASNAATLTVNTDPATVAAQQFKNQLEALGAATVTVTSPMTIDLSLVGGATVTTGKLIEGADATSTIIGSLTIATATNDTIIRGINFTSGTLIITGANDVDVSHCTFTDTPVVINGGADNIAFSWNKFTATSATGAGGGSAMRIDNAGASTGILLDHNYFIVDGFKTDIPAVTNSRAVMFNNYIVTTGSYSAAAATIVGSGAQLLSEHNIYQGIHNPLAKQGTGKLRALDNFIDAITDTLDPGTDIVFVPAYSRLMYPAGSTTPLDAAAVATLIATNAGNTAGKNSVTPPASVTNAAARIAATVTGAGSFATAGAANVPAGGSFTLTASAINFTPTTRQWYLDNFAIPGATASTHVVTNATAADAGAYAVTLTTPAGEIVTSAAFTVTVGALAAPVITAHPASQTITAGGSVTFNVTATGQSLAYQWQKNSGGTWADIPGATAASYTITNARQSEAASYRVLVSNPSDTKTSNPATLTVNAGGGGGGDGNNNGGNSNSGGSESGGGGGAPGVPWLCVLASLFALRATKRR